ncbi:unnamed protein product [Cuscuta campestris]|uniref:Uncharacterized protein n=1 Tax=Cuscuta campestris TaxID=132261 RepID=A0A484M297_9ASTE|nr:unnamed protein product [Cuscuta campestris]
MFLFVWRFGSGLGDDRFGGFGLGMTTTEELTVAVGARAKLGGLTKMVGARGGGGAGGDGGAAVVVGGCVR